MNPKNTVRWMVVATLTIGVVLAGIAPYLRTEAAPAAQTFSAQIVPVAGLIQYRGFGSQTWINVRGTQLVAIGDEVRVGANGYAQMRIVPDISVDLFPSTHVVLQSLERDDTRGNRVNIVLLVGTTFTSASQPLTARDRVQIVMPTAGTTVTSASDGASFYTFTSPAVNGAVIAQKDVAQVETSNDRTFTITREDFVFIKVEISQPAPILCSISFIDESIIPTFVVMPLDEAEARLQALKEFLAEFLRANVNPFARRYLRELIFPGRPAINLAELNRVDEQKELQELFDGIAALTTPDIDLVKLLDSYRNYWLNIYSRNLADPLALPTCGNGLKDLGETFELCPDDFTDPRPEACGNGLCETDRLTVYGPADVRGESVISCAADCLQFEPLARSCSGLIRAIVAPDLPPLPETPPPGGTPPPAPTPEPTREPTPSGIIGRGGGR